MATLCFETNLISLKLNIVLTNRKNEAPSSLLTSNNPFPYLR